MAIFRSEAYSAIPLPPEVSFEEAFFRLDKDSNSFYLLELDDGSYMQCGGSPAGCAVEVRRADADGILRSYVIGRSPAVDTPCHIDMSEGGVWVRESEILVVAEAQRLFGCFLEGQPLPSHYLLRDRELHHVKQPSGEVDGDSDEVVPHNNGQAMNASGDPPAVRWLAADAPDNEFGIEGYHCAEYVRSRISTTSDENIAQSFIEGRTSEGTEHAGCLPEDAVALDCSLTYELAWPIKEGVLFRVTEMEDKWDIFHHGDRLLFVRSWTGTLALVAEIEQDGTAAAIRRVWASSKMAQESGLLVRQIDYLVRSHVLGRVAAHPLPSGLPRDTQAIGDYSFGVFGRNCEFGSFGETTGVIKTQSV